MKIFKIPLFFIFLVSLIVSCVPGGGSYNDGPSDLTVDRLFSSEMVLQRNVEIPVWGTAFKSTEVKVEFNGVEVETQADKTGNWKVNLPKQKAGGPYELKIIVSDTTVVFKDVLVGEVWIASGQSNMELDMSKTLNGKENALKANNPMIRIFKMNPTYPTGAKGIHTIEELKVLSENHYFKTDGWVKADSSSIKKFSAVAYYFAEKLQKGLNIPVGIIHNSVPGSPIESWMSKKMINSDTSFAAFSKDRWLPADTTNKDPMVSIAYKQISRKSDSNQRHPWMPTFCYDNGIKPIENIAFKGMIWYQGESNAEYSDLYSNMFKLLISTWRKEFNNDFPFYYVQLSSRGGYATWPKFRNMQREVLSKISNAGMVVISDVGDKDDTHAKKKQPVGERLAALALGKTYGIGKNYESPLFDKMDVNENVATISFKGVFSSLKTNDEKEVRGFQISLDGDEFKDVKVEISGKTIVIELPNGTSNVKVRYAWKPFTDANLESANSMPVSTFRTL
ncbi:MAG: hypothetical protein KAH10_05170 [Flavobacteriales bacterium]|nr:hypothetical protein [Flavobacteriales bacterium]